MSGGCGSVFSLVEAKELVSLVDEVLVTAQRLECDLEGGSLTARLEARTAYFAAYEAVVEWVYARVPSAEFLRRYESAVSDVEVDS